MSDDYQRVEIITGTPRRRRWTVEQKLRIVEESQHSGESSGSRIVIAVDIMLSREVAHAHARDIRREGCKLMLDLGMFETLLLVAPVFIVAVVVVLLFTLVWQMSRLSGDIRAVRDAVEYIADGMEERRRNRNELGGQAKGFYGPNLQTRSGISPGAP